MSYILDALRRAEAERERGAVPSLQSQQHTVIEEDEVRAPRSRRLVWVSVGLGVALVAAVAWSLFGGSASPPRPIAEGAVAPAATPAVPPLAVPAATALPSTVPAAPPTATAATPALPAPAPVPSPTLATPAPRPSTAGPADARRSARRGTEAAAAPAVAARAAPPPGATTENRIYTQAELPEEIRRDLPRVAINGSSYSGDAASRMVMINGQVFHEGDRLAAGLVLEKINRRSAVLAYKGWRYEVAF